MLPVMTTRPRLGGHTRVLLASTILSVLVGVLAFSWSGRTSSHLALKVFSVEGGTGTVVVEGAGAGGHTTRTFTVADAGGKVYTSVVQLPAVGFASLRILPLAGANEIVGLALSNDTVSYTWDESGACWQRRHPDHVKREPCRHGSPAAVTDADGSILIVSIPGAGFDRSVGARTAIALCAVLGLLLGGAWLLQPNGGGPHVHVERVFWLAVVGLYAYQFSFVLRCAVDVPFIDDWDYFRTGALPKGFTLRWLFSFHNEHRLVPTYAMAWLNLKLFGLDFALQKVVNYLLFGLLLGVIVAFKNRVVGKGRFALFPAFLVFLVSPIAYENHLWAFQSQMHLVLLFSIWSLLYAFREDVTLGAELAFSALCVLAAYTFSAGVAASVAFLCCRIVYVAAGLASGRMPADRRAGALLVAPAVLGAGLLLWFQGYPRPGNAPSPGTVFGPESWEFFLNLVSLGFGFTKLHPAPGIAGLIVVLLPLAWLLKAPETRWKQSTWMVLTLTAGTLAMIAAVAVGRAQHGAFLAKISRYAEVSFVLIPAASLAWWLALRTKVWRGVVLSLAWGALFIGYLDNWSTDVYWAIKQQDLETLECVERYFADAGDGFCNSLYPKFAGTPDGLERARRMNVKFTRQFATTGFHELPR